MLLLVACSTPSAMHAQTRLLATMAAEGKHQTHTLWRPKTGRVCSGVCDRRGRCRRSRVGHGHGRCNTTLQTYTLACEGRPASSGATEGSISRHACDSALQFEWAMPQACWIQLCALQAGCFIDYHHAHTNTLHAATAADYDVVHGTQVTKMQLVHNTASGGPGGLFLDRIKKRVSVSKSYFHGNGGTSECDQPFTQRHARIALAGVAPQQLACSTGGFRALRIRV